MSRRVVELAGPAGAGKTTLARRLASTGDAAPATVGLDVGRLQSVLGAASAARQIGGARLTSSGRWLNRAELRSVGYLEAWPGRLQHCGDGDVILDHGPVYRLASLLATGPPLVRTGSFQHWWRRTAADWAGLLDIVVWLDAPDEVLRQRIDIRARHHRVRGADRAEANAFLARYREAYARTLDVVGREGARVVQLDTTASSPDALVAALHQLLASGAEGYPR